MRAELAIVCTVALAGSALAQDRAALLERVQRASAQATAGNASASERIAALDRVIEARSQLLGAASGDAYEPVWLLDQAADLLTRQTLDMADTRLVVGILDDREWAAVLEAASLAYEHAQRAGTLIEARFETQRGILDAGGELAEGDRELNRRLAESEQAVRRPLLMGRAMALRVAGGHEGADGRRVVEVLDGLRVGSPAARVVRDNALALALAQVGGEANIQRARALLEGVIAEAPADAGGLAIAEAALLRGRLADGADARAQAIAEATDRAPFVDQQGLRDAALLVLAIEARARVLAEGGQVESAARTLIGIEDRRELAGTVRQWAAVADQRLASLTQSVAIWSGVAPDVVLRAARAMVVQDRPELDARSAAMLSELLERFEAEQTSAAKDGKAWSPPPEQAPAMELLARLLLAGSESAQQRARAVELVWELLDVQGADLSGLLPSAATLVLGPLGREFDVAQRRGLLEAALDRAPDHASAHRWQLGLAAMLVEAGTQWSRALDLAEAAMRSPDATTRDDAIALVGATHAMLVSRLESDDRGALPTLRRALQFVRTHPTATSLEANALALRMARVLINTGSRDEAAEAFETLRGLPGKEAMVLRARALDRLGSATVAFAAYREARQLVSPQADGEMFWLVSTRLLELADAERRRRIAAQGADAGDKLEDGIRKQLIELKSIDSALGGRPWAGRLRAVEAGLDG